MECAPAAIKADTMTATRWTIRAVLGAWAVATGFAGAQQGAEAAEPATVDAQPAESIVPTSEPEFRELADRTRELVEAMAIADEVVSGVEPSADGLSLTLELCEEMALANNPQIRIADDAVDVAEAQVGQARAPLKPQIGSSTAFTHTDLNTGGGAFPLNLLGDITQSSDDIRTDQVSIEQVFYAGGQLRAALRASKYLAESEAWRKEATVDEVVYQTREAYYGVILAKALIDVAADSVRAFERHVKDTQQMFDVGMISQFELLRANTELSARKSDLVRAQNALKLAEASLLRILNLPQDTPIALVEIFPPIVADVDLTALTGQALELRPEVRALHAGIGAGEEGVTAAKGSYKPQVGGSAQWQNTHKGGALAPDGWTYTLGAQWDIYAGGRRKHELAEARASLSSLRHQLEDVENLVRLDVKQAYIGLYNAMAQIVSEYETVQLAREGLRLANLRFTEGVGTQVEELDAELALTNAQVGLARAFHDYAVARAALERSVGASWQARVDHAVEAEAPIEAGEEK